MTSPCDLSTSNLFKTFKFRLLATSQVFFLLLTTCQSHWAPCRFLTTLSVFLRLFVPAIPLYLHWDWSLRSHVFYMLLPQTGFPSLPFSLKYFYSILSLLVFQFFFEIIALCYNHLYVSWFKSIFLLTNWIPSTRICHIAFTTRWHQSTAGTRVELDHKTFGLQSSQVIPLTWYHWPAFEFLDQLPPQMY